jgi:hypothetical protein
MSLEPIQLWTAAGVLIGFQISSFGWRISREAEVDEAVSTWLPPADIVNLFSMMITALGVFILPILGVISAKVSQLIFGFAMLLFVGYPFALAGHYDMYNKGPRSFQYFPRQEKIVIAIIAVAAVAYVLLAAYRLVFPI